MTDPLDSPSPGTPQPSPEGDPGPGAPQGTPQPPLVRMATLFYGVLLGVAWLWTWVAGTPLFFDGPDAAQQGIAVGRDLSAGLLFGGITILISQELTRRTAWGDALGRELAAVLGRLSVAACVALALMSGVAEEALFRGVLQPRVGLIGASLLFGLAHLAPSRALLPWTAFSVLAGFGFGVLFHATGNLLASIAAHVLINAVNLWFLSRRYAT